MLHPVLQIPGPEQLPNQVYESLVLYPSFQNVDQDVVVDVVETPFDVALHKPADAGEGFLYLRQESRFFEYVSAGCLQFFRAENHEMCFERSVHRCFLKSCERLLVPVCRLPPGYPAGAARFHFSWGCTASWRGGVDNCGPAVF